MQESNQTAIAWNLPWDYIARVKQILSEKGRPDYSDAYISRVKNGHHENLDIQECLLLVEKEYVKRRARLAHK